MSQDILRHAAELAAENHKAEARHLLIPFLRANPGDVRAWKLLAQVAENHHQAADCWAQIVRLRPHDAQAKRILERLREHEQHPLPVSRETRLCPYCAEVIYLEASTCRFCGRTLDEPNSDQAAKRKRLNPALAAIMSILGWLILIGGLVMTFSGIRGLDLLLSMIMLFGGAGLAMYGAREIIL